jgi:hypothetical protein
MPTAYTACPATSNCQLASILRCLAVLLAASGVWTAEKGFLPHDAGVLGPDGTGGAIVAPFTASFKATRNGSEVGPAVVTVAKDGTLSITGLEKQGIAYKGPAAFTVSGKKDHLDYTLTIPDPDAKIKASKTPWCSMTMTWRYYQGRPFKDGATLKDCSLSCMRGDAVVTVMLSGRLVIPQVVPVPATQAKPAAPTEKTSR